MKSRIGISRMTQNVVMAHVPPVLGSAADLPLEVYLRSGGTRFINARVLWNGRPRRRRRMTFPVLAGCSGWVADDRRTVAGTMDPEHDRRF